MILQRYTFGSKSQHWTYQDAMELSCLWYCKDIHLEANHNYDNTYKWKRGVAYDIAKIYIWKQITTSWLTKSLAVVLLMILQRYTFGSKSQQFVVTTKRVFVAYDIAKIYIWKQITTTRAYLIVFDSCLWYCKDIHLEANHNFDDVHQRQINVAYDIAKIYIWKQITTNQQVDSERVGCLWYCKDIHLEANHNIELGELSVYKLLMILQRYTFGSKSQLILTRT